MPNFVGTSGNDNIAGSDEDDLIDALEGDDVVNAGGSADVVNGGAGNDQIYGSMGDDRLNGGSGFDLLSGGVGNDILDGGDDGDTAYYGGSFAPITVNLGAAGSATSDGTVLEAYSAVDEYGNHDTLISIENATTGYFDDTLLGNESANILDGQGGGDIINGRGGDDVLVGGAGWDTLTGGAGNDIFSGTLYELRNDTITDIEAGDRIHISDMFLDNFEASIVGNRLYFPGGYLTLSNIRAATFTVEASPMGGVQLTIISTAIEGTSGNDTLNGTANEDAMFGFDGNDTLDAMGGNDLLNGGAGNDTLIGGSGVDIATYIDSTSGVTVSLALAGAQNTGGAGMDTLSGIEGLIGSPYNDSLTGDATDNLFVGFAGNDTINGGTGIDTVDYAQERGERRVFVNLSTTTLNIFGSPLAPNTALDSFGNTDTLISIEHVITGDNDDYVYGGNGDERIETGAGTDSLIGNGGADIMIGGAGNDTYYFKPSEGDQVIDLAGGGTDEVYMLDQVFSLVGYENIEILYGYNAAGHVFTGNALANIITGYSGNDVIDGAGGDDELYGGSGNDTLNGGGGLDVLYGNAGNDTLSGNDGDDFLSGQADSDILTGGAGVDVLYGGSGTDQFRDTAAGFNGDTIGDLAVSERIVFTDANIATFTYSISGKVLTYTGGSLTLTTVPGVTPVVREAAGGGVELVFQTLDVANDFNGDGRSDILWRNVDGSLSNWLGQANGGFVGNDANAFSVVPTNWQVAGVGDFNGDGRDDILWRSTTGQVSDWLGTANGGFAANDANAFANVPTSWQVTGVGDFNGDGRDDILWRNSDGTLSNWLGTASGGFTPNDANARAVVPTNWSVVGVGDFNGDGRDDILWRSNTGQLSNWLGTANGGFAANDANAFSTVPTSWQVAGVGDFNGDGRDDILWRNTNGQMSNWLGTASGGFVANDANAFNAVPTSWHIVAVGDYNGDGRDDILWRSDTGQLSNWLGTANGGFVGNDANALTTVPTSWHVQPEHPMI